MTDTSGADDDRALEGPDVETHTGDDASTQKPDGLGPDGTIPADPDGIAAGLSDTASHFNTEEDQPEE